MRGMPAHGVVVELHFIEHDESRLLVRTETNADGRCDEPLLQGDKLQKGTYELAFHAGDYFARLGITTNEPRFVDIVTLRFGVANPYENYHVPLLVTPWSWTTYRGS
jgi:5-hydroxyisourate hydrolase